MIDLTAVGRLTAEVGADYLEEAGVLPLRLDGDRLVIGTWRETVPRNVASDLQTIFGVELALERYPETIIRPLIRRFYSEAR